MLRHLVPAGLVAIVALVTTAVATGGSSAGADAAATSRTVASTTTSDFRVVVVAEKRGGGAAPAASATLRTYVRDGGSWRRTASRPLPGPYFWKVLTGRRAVCRLEIRTIGETPRFRPHAVVQLLQTPSLGCAAASDHPLSG
jgi:hypothetical protein